MFIGELSERTGLSTHTIRFYESIGLLPEPDRTASGYRTYAPGAVDRLGFIRDAQATGLSLDEIGSVLELKDQGARSCEHSRALVERHLAELDDQIERLTDLRSELTVLAERASGLDPTDCTDPHRCQVISAHNVPGTS